MDIDRLRYFVAVAQSGSLRAAAELVGISPPAMSKALKVLQHEMGVELLSPQGRGVVLSREGKRVLPFAAKLVADAETLPARAESSDGRELRVGTFEVFSTWLSSALISAGGKSTAADFIELLPGDIERALVQDEIDVGLTYLPVPTAGVEFGRLASVAMGVFTTRALSHRSIEEVPFVVPLSRVQGTPTRAQGLDGWPDHRRRRKVQYRVVMMETALQLCRAGRAAAFLPEFIVAIHNDHVRPEFRLVRHPGSPVKEGTQEVYLVARSGELNTALARRVAKAVRTSARLSPP